MNEKEEAMETVQREMPPWSSTMKGKRRREPK